MAKLQTPPNVSLFPLPIVLVSCLDQEKSTVNIITIAWCGVVASTPPQLSISVRPSRHTHKLITAQKSFVINIPSAELIKKVDLCGIKSGADTDKIKLCSFTSVPSEKIVSPMIKECPVNIECRLVKTLKLGSHDMFIGEVLAVHIECYLLDDKGNIDFNKAKPVVYNVGEYWDIGKKIGYYGYSAKQPNS